MSRVRQRALDDGRKWLRVPIVMEPACAPDRGGEAGFNGGSPRDLLPHEDKGNTGVQLPFRGLTPHQRGNMGDMFLLLFLPPLLAG